MQRVGVVAQSAQQVFVGQRPVGYESTFFGGLLDAQNLKVGLFGEEDLRRNELFAQPSTRACR